ncbi:MAG: EF-hand domain-containing protein [Bacteroidota bacterium]
MLNATQQQAFERLFNIFDKNGNGSVDENDFVKAFDDIKAESSPAKIEKLDKLARRWFLSISLFADSDKSRSVTKEEWMNWAAIIAEDAEEANEGDRRYDHFLNAVFAGISVNSDTTITDEEYAAWFRSFGLVGDKMAIFERLDTNGNGSLSKDEFSDRLLEFVSGDAASPGFHLFGE